MGAPRWLRLLLALCAWALRARACPRLCACPAPGAVHCTFRYFTAVPARIPAGARRVNLGYNSLLQLTETDFSGLEKLELLMLHSNEINSIPDKAFRDLHSLQVLKMSYNKVRVLQQDIFYGLKSLARLHMDHNRIEFVHPNVFYGLTSLRLVHLEGNLLTQLHPDTFITLRYIEIFKVSSIKHIYLSDNLLTSLPQELFSHLSELESIYLHGNPWSCDCSLHWFAEWAQGRPDIIKCKKDRSSSGAQQCPACANPQRCAGKTLADIPAASLVCTKPAIHPSLKLKHIAVPDDGDFSSLSPEDFIAPIGSMVLNMSDQAGSQGNLVCNIQKPKEMSPISFDKNGNNTVLKVSFSALLVCDISYENIQQLWSILALYSNSPLELERTILPTKTPFTSYKYKQIYSEKNELFTNIETELRAEPSWLMQNRVALQLDRTATTLNTLHIQYFTDAEIILPNVDKNQVRKSWTIISRDNKTETQHTVLVGGTVELECRAIGEPDPAVEWILADGSKVRAPYISEDGRIMVLKTGTFTLRTADSFDTGLYHCIGTNYADADILTFRITVVDPYEEHTQVNGAQVSTFVGDVLHLPCAATAVPDASISWVLPEHVILHHSVRNKHIFENGTLKIQSVTKQDSGYFRCVAANQYGVDLLVFQVHVKTDKIMPQKKPVAVGEGEEGSGNVMLVPNTRRENSLASLATLTAPRESATSAPGEQTLRSARRNSHGKTTYRRHRDKSSRRFRGHRRQFLSSARRVDPQRWAALLEKTKRNSTLTEKQTIAPTNLPIQALKSSRVSEDEEETSGDPTSPELESMVGATKTPSASPLEKAVENKATAELPTATSSTAARKTSAWVADAVTPPASPLSHSVSPVTRRPQMYLKPTVTSPKSQDRSDSSKTPVQGTEQSAVSYGASRTSTVFNAGHRLVYSEEKNSQHLKFVSVTPMASAAATSKHVTPTKKAEKLLVFAESIDKTLTKTDPQGSAVTVSEPVKESGFMNVHSTRKLLTPKLLGSANTTHGQVQLFGDVTTHTPQARPQHGRRRKISARRRIVRPDRIPGLNEHRYNPGSPGSTRGRAAAVPGVQPTTEHFSNRLTVSNSDSSLNPHSAETPLSPSSTTNGQLEHPVGAHGDTALLLEEKNELTARLEAASTAMPVIAEGTRADPQWKSEGSSQTNSIQPITLEPPPTIHTPHVAAEITRTVSTEISATFDPISPSVQSRLSSKNYQIGKITWEGVFGNDTDRAVLKKLPQDYTEVLPSWEASSAPPTTTAALQTPDASCLDWARVPGEETRAAALPSPRDAVHGDRGAWGKHPPGAGLPARASAAAAEAARAASLGPTATARPHGGALGAGRRRGQWRRQPQQGPASPRATATVVPPASTMPTSTGPRSAQAGRPTAALQGAQASAQLPPTAHSRAAATAAGPTAVPGTDTPVTRTMAPRSTVTPAPAVTPSVPAMTPPVPSTPAVTPSVLPMSAMTPPVPSTPAVTPSVPPTLAMTPTAAAMTPPVPSTPVMEPPVPAATPHSPAPAAGGGPTPGSAAAAPARGREQDGALLGSPGRRPHGAAATSNPSALGSPYPRLSAKPRIVGGNMAAFTVLANSDAFLPCEATGHPAPTIQWTKLSPEPEALEGRRERRVALLPNGTLSIAAVRVRDGGQYLCVAANRHGAARLLVTLSVVAYPPRALDARARLLTAHSGAPVAVTCKAEGSPAPTFSWILANRTYVSASSTGNSRVSVQPDGTLIIREVTVYDRGLYTCVASNPAGTDTLVVKLQVVAAPPVIVEERREHVEGSMGESLALPCTAKGNPQPSVHWVLSDGTVVKPLQLVKGRLFLFSNGTLHVRSMAPADSGTYECIATSSTGSERRVVRLAVPRRATRPTIARTSHRVTRLDFGEPLLLNCTATGEPEPSVIWRLPSRALVDQGHRMGSRIHVFPNGSLLIEAVTEKDAGDYLCVARNQIGDDLILLKVIITMKPAKIDQKQYFKKWVPYGKDFQVDCKASGLPAPEISWSLPDGTTINSAMQADDGRRRSRRYVLFDNGTLYLNKVGLTEEGDYTCLAQNTLGRDEMKIHVTVVTTAPRIKHGYKTYARVKAGDTALLDCEVVGEPKPKIFWLLPSSDMISYSRDRYLLHANGSLSVSRVKLLDAGEYMCVARNPAGDDTKLYKVDVVSKPPTINGLYANKTIMKVTAVRHAKKQIDCRAEGTPTPQIMWVMPDNIFLTAPYYGSRITVHQNGTLEIRNLRPSDTADFTCVARNDGGESVLVVQLQVLEMLRRPMFKNPFNEKVIAKPGKTNILNCSVDGNPPPEISWMLPNGTWLSGGTRSARFATGTNGTLTISNTGREDAGKYRCAARNQVGYIEKLIVLEVGRQPSILVHTRGPVQGVAGEPLSLHCLSEGSPKPHTAWTVPSGLVLDRPHISGKYVLLENGTLLIRAATAHDGGTYVCRAHNAAGDASVSVAVAVAAHAPRITSGPPRSVRTAPGAPLQLTCAALGAPSPHITWELPDRSVLSTADLGRPAGSQLLHPQGTLVIPNPRPSDSGMYRCIAKNHLGSDSTVTYIHVI